MTITKLFDLTLPGLDVSLADRLRALPSEMVNVAIYASNFIPFRLKVTTTGPRSLSVVLFDQCLNLEGSTLKIKEVGRFQPAVIEDIIALAGVPNLSFNYPTIVCPGASFPSIDPAEDGLTTVHLFHDSVLTKMRQMEEKRQGKNPSETRIHTLGLTKLGATFTEKVAYLVVEV
jgi:hypothetical protein